MKCCRIEIESFELNKFLSEDELKELPLKKYKKGEIIYFDKKIKMLIFKSGKVKVVLNNEGEEFILYFLEKNNIYIPYYKTMFEVVEDCEFYELEANSHKYIFANSNFCNLVLNSLSKVFFVERDIINGLVFEDCQKRVLNFIYDLAVNKGIKTKEGILIDIDLKISELADFVASRRQTVSSIINRLIKKGFLEKLGNKFLIRDLNKIKRVIF